MKISKEKFIDVIAMYLDDIKDYDALYELNGFNVWESESNRVFREFCTIISYFLSDDEGVQNALVDELGEWLFEYNQETIGVLYDELEKIIDNDKYEEYIVTCFE